MRLLIAIVMPRILRNLKIDDVSSVDVGAGRGVRVVLTKRDRNALRKHRDGVPDIYGKPLAFGKDVGAEALDYLKRDVSQDERDRLAGEGKALPDGSFPIANVGDLKNAIRAIGRAKNPSKAKAHIKARAKDLGQEGLIPDEWSKRLVTKAEFLAEVRTIAERNSLAGLVKNAMDFDDASEAQDIAEDTGDLMCCLQQAMCALDASIQSILCDDDISDKRPSIQTSFQQFQRYVDGLALGQDDDDDDTTKRDDIMSTVVSPAVQKIIDEAVAAAVGKAVGAKDAEIAKRDEEIAVLKMTDAQRQYFGGMTDDDEKKRFKAMSSDDRNAYMDKMKKRADDDPIVKSLRSEIEVLRKSLAEVTDERELEVAKRDARVMGLAQTDAGEVVMKMRRGDKDAIAKFEKYMVELAKSKQAFEKTSRAFDEIGHAQRSADGTGVTVVQELEALAADLRKKDPSLSPQQAFTKVYNDPANMELRKREQDERFNKMGRQVA